MPRFDVTAPDGRTIEVTAPEGATEAQAIAYAQANWATLAAATEPKKGVIAAAGKGLESLVSQSTTGFGRFSDPEAAAKAGAARGESIDKRYADQTSLDAVKKIYNDPEQGLFPAAKEVLRQVPYGIAEQLPSLAATIGTGWLGAKAGAALGTVVAPGVGTTIGGVAGGALGMFAPGAIQALGGNLERQAHEQAKQGIPVKIDTDKADVAAVVQGGLDVAGTYLGLGKGVVSKLVGVPEAALAKKSAAELENLARAGLAKTLSTGTAKYTAAEVPTEIMQQAAERWQAGLDVTSPDAIEEYKKTAYQTMLSAPIGAAGRVYERGGARQQVADDKTSQNKAANADAAAAQAQATTAEAARKTSPEYAEEAQATYLALEQKRKDLIASLVNTNQKSPTWEADKLANKETQAEIARLTKEEIVPAAQAYQATRKNLPAAPTPTPDVAPTPTPPADTTESAAPPAVGEQDLFGAAPEQSVVKTQQEALPVEQQRAELAQQMRALPELLEQHRAAAAQAATPEASLAAAKKFTDVQGALTQATEAFAKLPAAPNADTAQKALATATKKWELAREEGDPEAIARHAEKIIALRQQGVQTSIPTRDSVKLAGSETADSFNQRVVAPEMADGRAAAAADRVSQEAAEQQRFNAQERAKQAADAEVTATAAKLAADQQQEKDTAAKAESDAALERRATARAAAEAAASTPLEDRITELQTELDAGGADRSRKGQLRNEIARLQTAKATFEAGNGYVPRPNPVEVVKAEQARAAKSKAQEAVDETLRQSKERLQTLPGEKISFDARQEAFYDLEDIPDRIEQLKAKAADPAATKTTRNKALHDAKVLESAMALHEKQKSGDPADIAAVQETVRRRLDVLGQGIEAKQAALAEAKDLSPKQRQGRRDTIATIKREMKLLTKVSDNVAPPERAPVGGDYKSGSPEALVAASRKEAAESLRQAKEDNASIGYVKDLFDRELAGTGTTLAPRKVGPVVRALGDTQHKVQQAGAKRGITPNQAVKAANKETTHARAMKQLENIEELQNKNDVRLDEATLELELAKSDKDLAALAKATAALAKYNGFAKRLDTAHAAAKKTLWNSKTMPATKRGKEATNDTGIEAYEGIVADEYENVSDGKIRNFDGEWETRNYQTGVEGRSKSLSIAQLRAVDAGDAQALFKNLSEDPSVEPHLQDLAKRLSKYLDATKIQLEDVILTPEGGRASGAATSKLIQLDRKTGINQEVALHEGVHAAIERVLQIPESSLSKDQLKAKRELQALWAAAKNDPAVTSKNAKATLTEFSAEVRTNPVLRKQLEGKKWRSTTMMDAIKNLWLRLIGKTNPKQMLDAADRTIDKLMIKSSTNTETGRQVASEQRAFAKPANYGAAANTPLATLAERMTAQPTTLAQRAKGISGLWLRTQVEDMRAPAIEVANLGKNTTAQSNIRTTQFEYFQRKYDQLTPLLHSSLAYGAPVLKTDAKGLVGIEMSGGTNAQDVMSAISELPHGDAKAKMAMATLFMKAQRAMNKRDEVGMLGFKEGEAEAVLAQVKADPLLKTALDKVRKKYNDYSGDLLRFVGSTGALPKAEVDRMLADGDYIPLYQADADGQGWLSMGTHRIALGDIRHQPYLQALKGGQGSVLPLNESIMRNSALLINKGLRNLASKSAAYMYQDLGIGTIKRGEGPKDPSVLRFHQEPDANSKDDDGKRYIKLDTEGTVAEGIPVEMLIQAMEGTNMVVPSFLKLGAAAANLLRSGITRMPLYAVRQLIRDPMSASSVAGWGKNPLSAVASTVKEFAKQTAGTSDAVQRLGMKGLIQSQVWTGDSGDLAKIALQMAGGKDLGAIDRFLGLLDRNAMRADSATRALLHESYIKQGLSEVEADLATMASMNFHQRGASATVQMAGQLIPFANAQIQALSVLRKAMTGKMPFNEQLKIKKRFFNNAMLLFGTGLAYAAAMEDDETYKNASAKDRMSNWFIPVPGVEEPIKIPIPYESGYFFSAAIAVVDMMKEDADGGVVLKGLRDTMLMSVPGWGSKGLPQVIAPALEVATGTRLYDLKPLVGAGKERLAAEERYNDNTTEAAKALARLVPGVTPIAVEHVVKGYLGPAPLWIAGMVNELFAETETVERPTGRVTDTPFMGGLFQRKYGGADATAAYETANKATQAEATLSKMQKEGRGEALKRFAEDHKLELRQAAPAAQFKEKMQKLSEAENHVRAARNDVFTPVQRQEKIDFINSKRQETAAAFTKVFARMEASVE